MANEILCTGLQSKLHIHLSHGILVQVDSLMCGGILVLPVLEKFEKLLGSPFLKQAHKRALDCLHLGTGYFGNPSIAVDETTSNLFEFKITSDIRMDKDLGKFTRRDDEFGHKVDGIIFVATQLLGGCLIGTEFAVELR